MIKYDGSQMILVEFIDSLELIDKRLIWLKMIKYYLKILNDISGYTHLIEPI